MSVPIARRQLLASRGRTLAGIAGIAVALLLILVLKAIFAGMEERLTAYIDGTGADVIVAQQGVTTMHMTESALPPSVVAAIEPLAGLSSAQGILYRSVLVESRSDGKSGIVALVGGGPVPQLVSGRPPRVNEVVLDHVLGDRLGIGPGDSVSILGATLRVSGEVDGTAAITGSYAFVARTTLQRMLGGVDVLSYVLVRARAGSDPSELAARIEQTTPGVTATTRASFAASERRVVSDMSTGIVNGMVVVGFVVGVAVAGLVGYGSALRQLRDFAVLRALGLSGPRAMVLVSAQVMVLVAAGFLVALLLVASLTVVAPAVDSTLILSVRPGDVAEAAAVAGTVALLAALMPVLRVTRVEPASVFRSGS